MAEYNESEYFSDTPEEIAEREAQESLRRMVRTEIRRVQTGAADADIAEDIAREKAESEATEKRQRPRWMEWVISSLTGDIILSKQAKKFSSLLLTLAIIFIISCTAMSLSFRVDLRYRNLKKEVALLKERSIRTKERLNLHSSHSAIVRKLEERGIAIKDPQTQPKTLK